MKKTIVMVLAFALVLGVAIGGTLAWLQDITDPVVNTFTEGKVDIDLYETKDGTKVTANSYKMVPGDVLPKDPTVEVLAASEACWLFVKVEKTANVDTFLEYAIATGWTALDETNYPGVYYREVADSDETQKFEVLKDNKVTVKKDVTMANMNTLNTDNYPKLTFTAYAIQKANISDAAAAWAELNPTTTP